MGLIQERNIASPRRAQRVIHKGTRSNDVQTKIKREKITPLCSLVNYLNGFFVVKKEKLRQKWN